jgi:hypothetical protein
VEPANPFCDQGPCGEPVELYGTGFVRFVPALVNPSWLVSLQRPIQYVPGASEMGALSGSSRHAPATKFVTSGVTANKAPGAPPLSE